MQILFRCLPFAIYWLLSIPFLSIIAALLDDFGLGALAGIVGIIIGCIPGLAVLHLVFAEWRALRLRDSARCFFQLHLHTCIQLMFCAALLLWPNTEPIQYVYRYGVEYRYGFPFCF